MENSSLCYSPLDFGGAHISSAHTGITSANLFPLFLRLVCSVCALNSHSPCFIRVGSHESLSRFPGGHPFPSPLRYGQWAMWQLSSLVHYRPCWAHRGHGTVENVSAFTASHEGFPFPELRRKGFLIFYVWFLHKENSSRQRHR